MLERSTLGRAVSYTDQYDPHLLFALPRQPKRIEIGLDGKQPLPFNGVDLWTGYELSWLNSKGKPQVGIATFQIPAYSPYLIESKSFKLYLNSYNQTRLSSVAMLHQRLTTDLSTATVSDVVVSLILPHQFAEQPIGELEGEYIDDLDIEVSTYSPCPELLCVDDRAQGIISETLCSHLLKTNCPVTGQPDWGSIQICYTGPKLNREALLHYLIGFRQYNEFHEQCVERIFMDLWRHYQLQELTIYARYTRRGGLDINPYRSSHGTLPSALLQLRTVRQ